MSSSKQIEAGNLTLIIGAGAICALLSALVGRGIYRVENPAMPSVPATHAAEYVEISVQMDSTWRSEARTYNHSITASCIVGTNDWFISGGGFFVNADVDYWLVGTNVVERRTTTSNMYLQQAKDLVSRKILGQTPSGEVISYPHVGDVVAILHPSPEGQPAGGTMANVVWLAFCSGSYLKHDGRQIPMPIGPEAFGYSDKTVVFEDALGLPKSVKLYATDGQLVCDYKVLQITNFLGITFPLKFRLVQYGQPAGRGRAEFTSSKSDHVGRVTSIKIGHQREVPPEVWMKLEK